MKIYLTGRSGGIGSAIKDFIKEDYNYDPHEVDWIIFAHGMINEKEVAATFDVNTLRCIRDTEALLPVLKNGIIFISSTASLKGNSEYPIYAASKAALNVYAKSLARKYKDKAFYALCPGPTNTKMWTSLNIEGNPQEPVEVAKAVKRIINGEFKGNVVITVRNGEVLCV